MSIPIRYCEFVKAVDTGNYAGLQAKMKFNWAFGSWTQMPCNCKPPCRDLTKKEQELLNEKLQGQMSTGRGIPLAIMFPIAAIVILTVVWIFGGL